MALKTLQAGLNPLGQFDGYDAEMLTFKGGEVVTLKAIKVKTDKAAYDAERDGYWYNANETRAIVTKTLASGNRPLFLADEGDAGYGTLFGELVGSIAGATQTGTRLGPHTTAGSGKVTCWDKPGLYAVTLDAADTTSSTGLTLANATLDTGAALYATAAGLLTPNSSAAFEAVVVGRFIDFTTNGSLVTTPRSLVESLYSPTGTTSLSAAAYTQAVFSFNPEL